MVGEKGGLEIARILIQSGNVSEGYTALTQPATRIGVHDVPEYAQTEERSSIKCFRVVTDVFFG